MFDTKWLFYVNTRVLAPLHDIQTIISGFQLHYHWNKVKDRHSVGEFLFYIFGEFKNSPEVSRITPWALQCAQSFPWDPKRNAASSKLSRTGRASRPVLSNKFGKRLQSINNTVYKLSFKKPVEGTSDQARQLYFGQGWVGIKWVPSEGKWEFRVPCCEVKCTANMC